MEKTLIELLSEQSEQISIWIEENDYTDNEFLLINRVFRALNDAIEELLTD